MTSQTRKFIELADILALKLKCKACASDLAIPATRDMTSREEYGKLASCPVCRTPWAILGTSSYELTVTQFTGALNKLRAMLSDAPVGFTLSLEVKDEEEVV